MNEKILCMDGSIIFAEYDLNKVVPEHKQAALKEYQRYVVKEFCTRDPLGSIVFKNLSDARICEIYSILKRV